MAISGQPEVNWIGWWRIEWIDVLLKNTSWDFLGLTSCESMRILWLLMLLSLLSIYLNLITVWYLYVSVLCFFQVFPSFKRYSFFWTRQPFRVQEIMKTDGVEWTQMFKACIASETWMDRWTGKNLHGWWWLEHDLEHDFPYENWDILGLLSSQLTNYL